jgi:hypothetical protein
VRAIEAAQERCLVRVLERPHQVGGSRRGLLRINFDGARRLCVLAFTSDLL